MTVMTAPSFDIALLGRLLDATSLRHRVISQNVANVNTPGYQRQEVAFEDELSASLRSGGEAALAVRPRAVQADGAVVRTDGNSVTLEQEMTDLNKNALLHNAATQILSVQLAMMRSAISGK